MWKKEERKKRERGEETNRDSWVCRAAGCLIERGFLWARVDISVNEAFPRKPGGGHSCGEGLRHQWGCEGKAPALSIAILSSVAIKGFLTCHGGSIVCFKDGRVISFYFPLPQLLSAVTRRSSRGNELEREKIPIAPIIAGRAAVSIRALGHRKTTLLSSVIIENLIGNFKSMRSRCQITDRFEGIKKKFRTAFPEIRLFNADVQRPLFNNWYGSREIKFRVRIRGESFRDSARFYNPPFYNSLHCIQHKLWNFASLIQWA